MFAWWNYLSESLRLYLLAHFVIGIVVAYFTESGEIAYAYWFIAGMYLVAKGYIKALRWALYRKHRDYFRIIYPAAAVVAIILVVTVYQAGIPPANDLNDLLAIVAASTPFMLAGHIVFFIALSFIYFLIRIPINIRRRRAEKERRREAELEAQRAYAERQRLQAEHERQIREAAAMKVSDQQRRIDARADCELFYNLHLKHVGNRFPRESFEKFMSTYMTDDQPVSAVERRAAELRRVIQYHQESAKPPAKFKSVREVTEWYLKEKECLESLPINDEIRAEQLVTLEERYAELTQTMLEKIGT